MKRFQPVSLFGLIFFLFSCQEATTQTGQDPADTPQQETSIFDFPFETIINELNAACFEDLIDVGLFTASKGEEAFLNTVFPIDLETEKAAGKEIHQSFDFQFIEDERTAKLRGLLEEMRPFTQRNINYQIFLIEDPAINAWTIPGGYIYITTGILKFIQNDDELANVIGHEMGHNENKHTTKIIQKNAPKSLHPDIGVVVDLFNMALVAYNQPQELEADQSGFYLAYQAGYNPRKGLEFWKRLAEQEQQHFIDKIFRSHPYSAARYHCGQQYLDHAER